MNLLQIFLEPAILIITFSFLFFIITILRNYSKVKKNLSIISQFLASLNKNELSYRFNELQDLMSSNPYTMIAWEDFRKALIFPEKLFIASQQTKSVGEYKPEIYSTIDASYFFNEDTLVTSKINYKFIQAMPTLLTGLGPFFTFLKMAIAFTEFNFSQVEAVGESLNGLIANIQVAALCSVFAVGFSLLFISIEKILYNRMCKKYYLAIQKELIRLFDVVTSENFLIDLLKESKLQNINNEKLLQKLPEDIASAISKSLTDATVPYLENILYSLNKLNSTNSSGDVVDKLF